jgi:DNA-binding transcriptional ArsR family regulator
MSRPAVAAEAATSNARRGRPLPSDTITALADTFRILGDPTRVRIVDALASGQLCVHEISEHIGLSESAVSHQLRLMRSMRIVRARRQGRCVYYTLDDQHVLDLFQQGLRHVSEERR